MYDTTDAHTHTLTHTHYEIKGNKEKANKHRDFKQLSSDKKKPILSSVQLVSHVQLVVTPWTAECQAFVSITNPPELAQTHVHQVSDAIQPSHPTVPFSTCLQPFPASESFLVSQFFASGGQSTGVSASTSALPVNIQGRFPLGLTGLNSLQSRDSQESSLKPQLKSINSLVLNFLYDPTLISIHDHWKNNSFD